MALYLQRRRFWCACQGIGKASARDILFRPSTLEFSRIEGWGFWRLATASGGAVGMYASRKGRREGDTLFLSRFAVQFSRTEMGGGGGVPASLYSQQRYVMYACSES